MELRIMQYFQSSCHFQNIFITNLFTDTLDLCSSLSVTDQVWHSYKTTGKSMVLHILIFHVMCVSVKKVWRVLRLRMEDPASRCRG